MGIDINTISQIGRAIAVGERNENNRKHPGSRDAKHETWEDTNRKAAQNTVAIMALIAAVTIAFKLLGFFGRLSIKVFGPKLGKVINIVCLLLMVIIPACSIVNSARMASEQREEQERQHEEAEAARQKKFNDFVNGQKTNARNRITQEAEARGIDKERTEFLLTAFDNQVKRRGINIASTEWAVKDGINSAERECWRDLAKHDEPLIKELLKERVSKVWEMARAKKAKLSPADYLKAGKIDYWADKLKYHATGTSVAYKTLEEAKLVLEKEIGEIESEIQKQ